MSCGSLSFAMFRRKLIKFLLVVIASLLYHGTSVKLRDILSLRGLRRSENVNALVRSGIQVVSTCPLFYNQSTYGTLKLVDNNQDIEVKYYLPSVFQKLRKLAGFEEDEYHNILSASKFNEIVADSKSRQAFLKSDDDRLLVKTISHRECKLLCSIAVSLTQYIEQAKCTCLNNILGLYEILCRGDVVYVLISKNIFYSPVISNSSSPNLFDIKGSLVGRCKSNISKVWKDLDLIRSPFVLDTLQSPVLLDALQKDVNFLSKHGLMDYSLLICKSCRTGHEPFISCK